MLNFQDIIDHLQNFWKKNKCIILQPYDIPVGAGTLHPATAFSTIKKQPWNVCYVQPSRRPSDGRFTNHPTRSQHYYQMQVILNPVPDNFQEMYIESLKAIQIQLQDHDINFLEDNWKSPTLGAFGLGWEVVCNGMEISQITYMQKIAGIVCNPHIGEITYGLERLALIIQNTKNFAEIIWSDNPKIYYKDIFTKFEEQHSAYNFQYSNTTLLIKQFNEYAEECLRLVTLNAPYVAYDYCLLAIHTFNLLDSRGVLSKIEREKYISRTQKLATKCIQYASQIEQAT